VQLIDKLEAEGKIKEEQSTYAEEGTKAHEVCEAMFKGQRIPHDPSNDMLDHCKAFVKYCRSFAGAGTEQSEIAVPLFYLKTDTGSVDFLTVDTKGRHIHVIDLKYGAGVAVKAEGNKQLSIYARSAIETIVDIDSRSDWKVSLHIYQPRTQDARDTGIPFSRWDMSLDSLYLFTEKNIGVPAQLILDEAKHLLKFVPGNETCKWCPAKGDCAARTRWLLDGTPIIPLLDGEEYTLDLLTDDEKLNLFEKASDIRDLLKNVESALWQRAREGKPLPGTKLVEGRGSREWLDQEKAEKFLCDQVGESKAFTRALISVAQAEKILPTKDALKPFTLRKPGAPVLALAEDKRREWHDVSAQKEFQDQDLADAVEDAI
jgi:hypothetical protein